MYNVTETAPLPNGRALWVLDLKGIAHKNGLRFFLASQAIMCVSLCETHSRPLQQLAALPLWSPLHRNVAFSMSFISYF